jgi:hypothetical protein
MGRVGRPDAAGAAVGGRGRGVNAAGELNEADVGHDDHGPPSVRLCSSPAQGSQRDDGYADGGGLGPIHIAYQTSK